MRKTTVIMESISHQSSEKRENGHLVPSRSTKQADSSCIFNNEITKLSPKNQIGYKEKKNGTVNSLWNMRILSAIFYALSSLLITVVNKIVLTSYGFPSYQFLALGQICATIIILKIAKDMRLTNFSPLERNTFAKIFPLPFLYLGNAVFGLGGTKQVNLPMFTSLRRFAILMTMFAEYYLLGTRASFVIQVGVYTMVLGAILASWDDTSFNLEGYSLVAITNCFTTANGICIKQKQNAKEFGQYGLVYYNALFMLLPFLLWAYFSGEIQKALRYDGWLNPSFLLSFLLSCIMGFLLNASTVLCTHYNSALATSIVGCLKNVSVTYFGMIIGGDYVFSLPNFVGINISVLGSFLYTYVTFKPSNN